MALSADPVTYCTPHPTLTSKANYFNVYYVIYPPSIHTYKGTKVDSLIYAKWTDEAGLDVVELNRGPNLRENVKKRNPSAKGGDFPQSSY